MTRRATMRLAALAIVAVTLAYLRDPAWLSGLTSGFTDWDRDEQGAAFRWTTGHSSFFVPSDATSVAIPVRAVFSGGDRRPVVVRIALNDRPAAEALLTDAGWTRVQVICAGVPTYGRRHVRVDLRISRAWTDDRLTVQVGDIAIGR
jgi:hypothetical protein